MDAHPTVWSCLASGQSRRSRPPAGRAAPCRHRMHAALGLHVSEDPPVKLQIAAYTAAWQSGNFCCMMAACCLGSCSRWISSCSPFICSWSPGKNTATACVGRCAGQGGAAGQLTLRGLSHLWCPLVVRGGHHYFVCSATCSLEHLKGSHLQQLIWLSQTSAMFDLACCRLTRISGYMMDSFSQMAQGFHGRVAELQEVALLRVDGKLLLSCCTVQAMPESLERYQTCCCRCHSGAACCRHRCTRGERPKQCMPGNWPRGSSTHLSILSAGKRACSGATAGRHQAQHCQRAQGNPSGRVLLGVTGLRLAALQLSAVHPLPL